VRPPAPTVSSPIIRPYHPPRHLPTPHQRPVTPPLPAVGSRVARSAGVRAKPAPNVTPRPWTLHLPAVTLRTKRSAPGGRAGPGQRPTPPGIAIPSSKGPDADSGHPEPLPRRRGVAPFPPRPWAIAPARPPAAPSRSRPIPPQHPAKTIPAKRDRTRSAPKLPRSTGRPGPEGSVCQPRGREERHPEHAPPRCAGGARHPLALLLVSPPILPLPPAGRKTNPSGIAQSRLTTPSPAQADR